MGTMKSLPEVIEPVDYDQNYSLIEMSDRVFIHDTNLREKISNYSLQCLAEDNFNQLMDIDENREFCDYKNSVLQSWTTGCQ